MNIAMIVPTGIGAEIGGHAGDANPAARLIGQCCERLITHPNVVNASDINEMPENAWYVEGSILDRLLRGELYLKKPYQNKMLLVVNPPISTDTVNSVSAARMTLGADIDVIELETPLEMEAYYDESGKADGRVSGWWELCQQVEEHDFDALAIQTEIKCDRKTKETYLKGEGGVNPWGGVEAKASKMIAGQLDKPVAHAPVSNEEDEHLNYVTDPRMAAEMVSISYMHCILKGLHKAPRIDHERGLGVEDLDALISPYGCIGEPHWGCMEEGVPIIYVKNNTTIYSRKPPDNSIIVENYHEAAGVLMGWKAGVSKGSLERPPLIPKPFQRMAH